MPSMTFNPSGNAWGDVGEFVSGGVPWGTIQGSAGNFDSVPGNVQVALQTDTGASNWNLIRRAIINFDTSTLPAGSTVTGATLSIKHTGSSGTTLTDSFAINVFGVSCGSPSSIATSDFANGGSTGYATALTLGGTWDVGSSPYTNLFTFNASGIAAINPAGYSQFMLRESNFDAPNVAPTWSASSNVVFTLTSTASNVILTVTYTAGASSTDPLFRMT